MTHAATIGPLGDADLGVLALLARLPLIWTDALACLLGWARRSTVFDRVAGLRREGLVGAVRLPVRPGLTPLLLYPTDRGVAALAAACGEDAAALVRGAGLRPNDLRALVPGLPHRLACYELLVATAGTHAGAPELVAWECPWRRAVRQPGFSTASIARLPAGGALRWPDSRGSYLLLPDEGAVPPRAYREALVGLVRLRRTGCPTPLLVVAAPDDGRAGAWRTLLEQIKGDAGASPAALVTTWGSLPSVGAMTLGVGRLGAPAPAQLRLPVPDTMRRVVDPFAGTGRPVDAADRLGRLALLLAPRDRRLLEVVGLHPFLPVRHLATVLGSSVKWTRARRDRLVRLGLVRLLGPRRIAGRPSLELAELTRDGAAIVAAQLGLTPGQAARFLGLVAWAPVRRGAQHKLGTRGQLLQHLRHTIAVDAVFVHLYEVARRRAAAGGDDALLDWRNAAACARGHLRPDGYGLYRHNGRLYGFLLEYDGGTEGPGQLRRKFARYYRYRDERGADGGPPRCARDFADFPTVLVVARDYGEEKKLAAVLRALAVGRAALPVLLTTRARIGRDPDGMLGPVWRLPSDEARRFWLQPDGPPKGANGRGAVARTHQK